MNHDNQKKKNNKKILLHAVFQFAGCTLNSLGTMSLGVFTPTRASTPQKRRMVKMMAKSLISFLTWREGKKTGGLTLGSRKLKLNLSSLSIVAPSWKSKLDLRKDKDLRALVSKG